MVTLRTAGHDLLDGLCVVQRERLAKALFQRAAVAVRALIPTRDERGVGAELLNVFLNLLIEAGDERGDKHDDADTEHDAKNGERAAQLVRAERVHRLLEIFAVRLRH